VSDVRVFLSFDVDHDEDLCELFSEQSHRGEPASWWRRDPKPGR
jgi:hypothetical protein